MATMEIIGLLFLAYNFYILVKRLGRGLAIPEFIALLAGIQWVLAPLIQYHLDVEHFKYFMRVSSNEYFRFSVWAYLMYGLGLFGFKRKRKNDIAITAFQRREDSFFTIILVMSVSSLLLIPVFPSTLKGFLGLISNLLFVPILYYSLQKKSWIIMLLFLLIKFLLSLGNAMFHDILILSFFAFSFWSVARGQNSMRSSLLILFGFIFIVALQVTKFSFREKVWRQGEVGSITLFLDNANDVLSSKELTTLLEQNVIRFNQGWIVAAVMKEVPAHTPHDRGQIIIESVLNSILPRFLFIDKKEVGGRENFKRYTGLELKENATMSIGVVGEAYVSFGVFFGALFLFLWGRLLRYVYRFMSKNPRTILFIPFIFMVPLKAETDLYSALNHLLKSSLILYLLFSAGIKLKITGED